MVTVGYGDINPVNSTETILAIVTMLSVCGVFAYSINEIG
jgi:hypothetical protein